MRSELFVRFLRHSSSWLRTIETSDWQHELLALIAGSALAGFAAAGPPNVDSEGTVHVPAFEMPFSDLASPEALAGFLRAQKNPQALFNLAPNTSIAEMRRLMDEQYFNPLAAKQRAAFQVTMQPSTIGGVPVEIYTPTQGISQRNAHRVLINMHGGAFSLGAHTESQIESIPLAGTAQIKVISVDYRQGPEYRFPAASEDIAAVYRELIKTYKPTEIGIYGCSAGGVLTGEAMAWFQKVGLPNPAGIGIFGAHTQSRSGDSQYTAGRFGSVVEVFPTPPPKWPAPSDSYFEFPKNLAYFAGTDHNDPLVIPSASPAVLAKFPPTLLIVGSRDIMASGASRTQIQLAMAGVDARFFSWDGMDHCFINDPDFPESRGAYQIMTNFFEEQFDKAKH
jgi:epsilon-lactone hydrolase